MNSPWAVVCSCKEPPQSQLVDFNTGFAVQDSRILQVLHWSPKMSTAPQRGSREGFIYVRDRVIFILCTL